MKGEAFELMMECRFCAPNLDHKTCVQGFDRPLVSYTVQSEVEGLSALNEVEGQLASKAQARNPNTMTFQE